jgi:hypothetical protein
MDKKMSFENRRSKAMKAENAFADYCIIHNIPFAYSGCENIPSKNNFSSEISKIKTLTGRFVRHWPDFIIITRTYYGYNDTQFVEVKNAYTIEKEAYDDYMKLAQTFDINVLIVFLQDDVLYLCAISELVIKPVEKHKYKILDGKWVSPRTSDNYDKAIFSGSGTDYGYIDFDNTSFYKL